MNSIAENQQKINTQIDQYNCTWRYELGCLRDVIGTFHTFSQAIYELNRIRKGRAPDGLYLLDRFAAPGRPELWGVGELGVKCISRREA